MLYKCNELSEYQKTQFLGETCNILYIYGMMKNRLFKYISSQVSQFIVWKGSQPRTTCTSVKIKIIQSSLISLHPFLHHSHPYNHTINQKRGKHTKPTRTFSSKLYRRNFRKFVKNIRKHIIPHCT